MGKYGEPWEFEAYPADDFAGDHGWGVLVTDGEDGIEVAGMVPPEYGNRAAACVNFCAGYTLPDDVTLGDVLEALRAVEVAEIYGELRIYIKDGDRGFWSATVPPEGHDIFNEWWERVEPLLAKFKKED